MQTKKQQAIEDQAKRPTQAPTQLKLHANKEPKPHNDRLERLSVRHVAVLGYN